MNFAQIEAEAASYQGCNAKTTDEAAELEAAAAAAEAGGKYYLLGGYGISGEAGAIEIEYCEQSAAEQKVDKNPDKFFAFQTIDADPVNYPKIFCNIGFGLLHAQDSPYCSTVHFWRPKGCLPTADEAVLFVDGLSLARKGSLKPRRPGRAEGLADEWGTKLCLFDAKVEPNDLRQGGLGNCWLISAFSALAEFPEKIKSLIKQTALSKSGRYNVKLFHPVDEEWVEVVVDDRFPVNEYGVRGSTKRDADSMLDLLMWLDQGKSIMCCGSSGYDDSHSSTSGVVQGHAYALLRIETNLGPNQSIDLMKLRNPHGQGGQEWSGNWSDGHPIWDTYPEIKAKLKPANFNDGTFWIARTDFVKEFRSISVCLSEKNAISRACPI